MILIKPSYEITAFDRDMVIKSLEYYGRICYKSEHKITSDSASKFIRQIVKSGHHSVIEHFAFTVKFICDRGVSHELVRHRLASFSQESTRYCNYSGGVTFIIPPWVNVEQGEYVRQTSKVVLLQNRWVNSMLMAEFDYMELLREGWSPQQARAVLPNSLKTEIIMTANLREWLHIFEVRCNILKNHPQMTELMIPLRNELIELLPEVFE